MNLCLSLAACKLLCLLIIIRETQVTYLFSYEFLTIYDGGSSTSPLIGKYCGASIPPSHISSSKELTVHFETDSFNGNGNGFKIEYNPTSKQITSI